MGIADIQKEVLSSAGHDALQIRKEAEKKAREILSSAKEKIEKIGAEAKGEMRRQIERARKKALEAAHFETSTSALRAKKEIIEQAISEAKSQLGTLPAEKRKRHLHSLIEKARQEIDLHHVLCAKKDIPYVKPYKAEEAPILGGIIAENAERTIRVDLSYETLFSELVEESLPQIYSALFGKP